MLINIISTFFAPEPIATSPAFFLWLLPLAVAVATVYKATRLEVVKWPVFFKEVIILFGSIVVFIVVVGVVLFFLQMFLV